MPPISDEHELLRAGSYCVRNKVLSARSVMNSGILKGRKSAAPGLLLAFLADSAKAQVSACLQAVISLSILPIVSITSSSDNDGAGDINFGLTIVNTTASINPNTSSLASLFAIGILIAFSFVGSQGSILERTDEVGFDRRCGGTFCLC